jgi:hypothetical protein
MASIQIMVISEIASSLQFTKQKHQSKELMSNVFFLFCEVGGLVIIQKRTWPNLASGK